MHPNSKPKTLLFPSSNILAIHPLHVLSGNQPCEQLVFVAPHCDALSRECLCLSKMGHALLKVMFFHGKVNSDISWIVGIFIKFLARV